MIRREFLGLLSAAAAWSLAAKADQRIPLIGILDPDVAWLFDAFVDGMRALGYEEGRNIRYERRSLHGKPETVGALAAELVALKPNVLVTVADFSSASCSKRLPLFLSCFSQPVHLWRRV